MEACYERPVGQYLYYNPKIIFVAKLGEIYLKKKLENFKQGI